MMKQTSVPFSLVVTPFAEIEEGEYPPPIIDMGEKGPVRCGRCKAYMCSFMQFVEGGRKYDMLTNKYSPLNLKFHSLGWGRSLIHNYLKRIL